MISGLSSSSIALAQRTASQARATMDTMSRQIATGQKVSSVKDDGAAWTRAATLRASATQANTLRDHIGQMESWAAVRRAGYMGAQELWPEIRSGLLSMLQPNLSASAFSALKESVQRLMAAEYSHIFRTYRDGLEEMSGPAQDQAATDRAYLRIFDDQGTDLTSASIMSPTGGVMAAGLRAYAGAMLHNSSTHAPVRTNSGGTVHTVSFDGQEVARLDTVADVQSMLGFLATTMDHNTTVASQIGQTERVLKQLDQRFAQQADRAERHAASLTDADMGKASTARAQAENRQQLALATVRQAISAYGSYAGGLLGNAQRTQAGVLRA